MITFVLNQDSGLPAYIQLEHQVRQAIRLGMLQPGDQLPTAREVVAALAINPNTVLKAYRELEHQGLVAPKPGLGTFVTDDLVSADPQTIGRFRRQLGRWIRSAYEAGLDDEDILAMFQSERAVAVRERSA